MIAFYRNKVYGQLTQSNIFALNHLCKIFVHGNNFYSQIACVTLNWCPVKHSNISKILRKITLF